LRRSGFVREPPFWMPAANPSSLFPASMIIPTGLRYWLDGALVMIKKGICTKPLVIGGLLTWTAG
jgi:hypothetical protein